MFEEITERFIRYAKVNTRSDESSDSIPTTPGQVELALMLKDELEELGLSDVEYNEANGYLTATLPANVDEEIASIGFIAHLDTADFNACHIQPQIHSNYQGGDIVLNEEEEIVLSVDQFPNLNHYIGQTLITTDGTTLLGSDDKSGIAEIITAMRYMLDHPEIEHGPVRIAFGPDEEIGRGAHHFDVDHFACDFAYTVDGGPLGELQYESFNAAQADLTFFGLDVHPGSAKGVMVNAIQLASEFIQALPSEQVPEQTEGRQGFYHVMSVDGQVEEAKLSLIVRDHDRQEFENKKMFLTRLVEEMNEKYGDGRVSMELYDQYYNMAEIIEEDPWPIQLAQQAMENLGIEPIIEPIRGGTDGSILSFMGLPTPNLFAGGENFHGRYEFVSVESMVQATKTIVEMIRLQADHDRTSK